MASDDFNPIPGMSDIVAPEVFRWQQLEKQARDLLHTYNFTEVRVPIVERTELFTRSLGDTTEVVQKEMYTFTDRGDRSLTLRPEGTAGVIRYIAGQGQDAQDARVFYIGPMFRAERPQAGRRRQFHQLGAEAIGEPSPAADAEAIAMQVDLLKAWGLVHCEVQINTRGLPEDRVRVADGLRAALKPHFDKLSDECKRQYDANVLRILDTKDPEMAAIVDTLPEVTSFMDESSRTYLDNVMSYLDLLGVDVTLNPRLVRGLDYYVHTVWEITHPALGAQDALCGGGRYEFNMRGKKIEGVGFAMGLERVLTALEEEEGGRDLQRSPDVWIISQSDKVFEENFILLQTLRRKGLTCSMDLRGKSMKAQLRAANRAGVAFAVIRGDDELEKGTFQLKNFESGEQEELAMPELLEELVSSRLKLEN